MLRLLGFAFLVIICVDTAPWGLAVGAILCVAWLFTTPASPSLSRFRDAGFFDKSTRVTGGDNQYLSAISLAQAVYCANCDLITNSPHNACRSCGSHSIIAVSRLWQLTVAPAPAGSARFTVNLTADVREIPAIGLSEAFKLIGRLTELGGELKDLHIQVDSVETNNESADGQRIELVKPVTRSANTRQRIHRQAS